MWYMSNLVIVESPAKAKTIKKYLGDGYDVIASVGHIRDLPSNRLAVDVNNGFAPKYEIIKGKEDIVEDLKKKAGKADRIYLATDPDREGEAISWHLAYILDLDLEESDRVEFNEITKTGISNGMKSPRSIDIDLVNAQQARRILDRLVGYKLSPFVSQKIHRGLSAGRVQSVALRIVVDREEEIRKFKPEEYWTVSAKLLPSGLRKTILANLEKYDNKKIKISNKDEADRILEDLKNEEFIVSNVKKGKRKKSPAPPFITSTLQQEASRKLSFQSKKTMRIAQNLYEGVDIQGEGATGLITYMRTDSLRISSDALNEAKEYILNTFGSKYYPSKTRVFRVKNGAQDGHEAIRPTMPSLSPDKVKSSLTNDQYKLYKLIWERFIASQMADSIQNTTSIDITAGKYLFKATGYEVSFDGFTKLYVESKDTKEEKENMLPPINEGVKCKVKSIIPDQHFTQPPARYNEASLIKKLEEEGIGRPSTYATTISTIIDRGYVKRENKSLVPTELGEVLTKLMKEKFKDIVDLKFTAEMESSLDSVESGDVEWVELLEDFYGDFESNLKKAKDDMKGQKLQLKSDETDLVCEKCGRPMVVKFGRYGKFIACSGYPECKNILSYVEKTGVSCPKCGGDIVVKHSKKGKTFYGCSNYPDCDYVSWYEPTEEKCPQCGEILYKNKAKKQKLFCQKEGCGYKKNV